MLYEFEVKSGAFAIGRHPRSICTRISPEEIQVFALVRGQQILTINEETNLKVGDSVWYAMSGDYAGQIADIFNDTTLDRRAIDDFYGDWMLSPSVKLKDVPFFTDRMKSELLEDGLITKNKGWSKNMWEQTVAEYIKDSLKTAPVACVTVVINEEWLLVFKEVVVQRRRRTIGLKQLEGSAVA
ncbi:hypothetical protein IQA86_18065 [Leptospira borgpetersenii serovar Balcanica]|nr:hypothetical protein [Leptospira borgpetersenii serovar Balcanica]